MLKLGICTIDDLVTARRSVARKRFRPNYYIGLYEEALKTETLDDAQWQERILEPFAVRNAVFKRTARERFSDFDDATIQVLRNQQLLRRACTVHDLAVSDARTACDLFDKLVPEFGDALEFYATDICLKVSAIRQPGGRLTLVVDPSGRLLQIVFPPFVLPVSTSEPWVLYPLNRVLRAVLLRTEARKLLSILRERPDEVEQREILLLCREAREHLARYQNFHVETYDMLEPPGRKFEIVRAMNIFNRTYFSDAVLARAVDKVVESLSEGGIFVTGSNQDAGTTVNGSIYRKSGGRFIREYESALGSPIDHLIAAARA
jgi:hypothetical protein